MLVIEDGVCDRPRKCNYYYHYDYFFKVVQFLRSKCFTGCFPIHLGTSMSSLINENLDESFMKNVFRQVCLFAIGLKLKF